MKKFVTFLFAVFCLSISGMAQFQVGSVTVTHSVLTTNLEVPWELVWGPDNFIWMTERKGRISRVNPATGVVSPLITLSDVTQVSESGLLGMALHPDFSQHPYVYVSYTYTKNNKLTEKLVRFTYNGTTLISPLILLDDINATNIHNGSRLLILPDLTMLMTTGDAANASLAQNLSSRSGKILRLNLDGSIPANNPVPNSYVYSFGHRNPQGLLRAPNGIIYSSEHGPSNDDEFNLIEPNRNYGWPTVEGLCNTTAEQAFCNTNNVREPLATWTPTLAVAGIARYDHPAIPGWQNHILMATLKASKLVSLELNAAGTAVVSQVDYLNSVYGRLRAICVSPAGKVYVGTSNGSNSDKIIVLQNLAFTPTGIRNRRESDQTLSIYSDQTGKKVYLKFNGSRRPKQACIFNITGKKVMEVPVSKSAELELDVKQLPIGVYFIQAGSTVKKVILN